MSWSLLRWTRGDDQLNRLEEKISDIRRELRELRSTVEAIYKIVKQLE